MAHEPFRVVAHLATPIALNHPWMHLDGLLAHCAGLRRLARDYYLLPTKRLVEMPDPWARGLLARAGGIPHASISWFDPPDVAYRSIQYYKRLETNGFPGRKQLRIGHGHFRAWMLRWVYLPVPRVVFYVCGDMERIRDLLSEVTHIGNDHRVGWGKIHRWEFERTPEDWSVVREGRAQRPIPVRLLRSWSDAVPLAWRPPYWARERVEPCAPPGAEVQLAR